MIADIRAVVLACRDGRLALAGGGVLRLATAAVCPSDAAGQAYAIGFDDDNLVVQIRLPRKGETLAKAETLPAAAFVIAPRSVTAVADGVDVKIDVLVPPRTPATDDVFLATERSGYAPAEIRMNRVDGRRFTSTIAIPRGTTLHFRISRGSYATLERDAGRAVPPPHEARGLPDTPVRVEIAAWTDID